MAPAPPAVTAVIPAFNEAKAIGSVVQRTGPFVSETIVVDDCSTDGTGEIAEQAGATVIRNCPGTGYIGAIKRGFAAARGEIVVTIDGDGELAPEWIPHLVGPIIDGSADMVQGARNEVPRVSEQLITGVVNRVAGGGDTGTGMRALRSDLARRLELHGACICGIFTLEVLAAGGRVTDVPIELTETDEPRSIAWYHGVQFVHVARELAKYLWRRLGPGSGSHR